MESKSKRHRMLSLYLICLVAAMILNTNCQVQQPKTEGIIQAEKDLEVALHKMDKTKIFLHNLNGKVAHLQKLVRTGSKLSEVKRNRHKQNPFDVLKNDMKAKSLLSRRTGSNSKLSPQPEHAEPLLV
jgi:biopolymer transport protein ExbD